MMTLIVAACVLLAALALLVELLVRRPRSSGEGALRFEWITNLGLGGVRGITELLTKGTQVFVFEGVRALSAELFGVAKMSAWSPWTWLLAFVGYDFLFYWAHRASHRSGLLWAVHEVHHQPTHYNLTVGLRVSILNSFSLLPFFLPLAVIGVPIEVYAGVALLHFLGMAWLHTEKLPTFGVLEKVLNTPALHRIHHSRAARHLDKNFGGVLIVWDRLFGTYLAPEPVLATGVHGRDQAPGVIGSHIEPLVYLAVRLRAEKSRWRKLKLLFVGA